MKGIYVLVINISKEFTTRVGSLGKLTFKPGFYLYVGSAQNGIEQRVKRHLRRKKRRFWHIDYLLAHKNAKVVKVFYKKAPKEEEFQLARKLLNYGDPIRGFGSSDSPCVSHLFYVKRVPSLDMKELVI
jgi:Uri superfamily endonuclease